MVFSFFCVKQAIRSIVIIIVITNRMIITPATIAIAIYAVVGNDEVGAIYAVVGNDEVGAIYAVVGNDEVGAIYAVVGNDEVGAIYAVVENDEVGVEADQ